MSHGTHVNANTMSHGTHVNANTMSHGTHVNAVCQHGCICVDESQIS